MSLLQITTSAEQLLTYGTSSNSLTHTLYLNNPLTEMVLHNIALNNFYKTFQAV